MVHPYHNHQQLIPLQEHPMDGSVSIDGQELEILVCSLAPSVKKLVLLVIPTGGTMVHPKSLLVVEKVSLQLTTMHGLWTVVFRLVSLLVNIVTLPSQILMAVPPPLMLIAMVLPV